MNRARLAVVDDDEPFAEYLQVWLRSRGYEATGYHSGAALLAGLHDGDQPDIILLDVSMPHMDGLQTLRAIRLAHPSSHVLMLSGGRAPATIVEAVRLGTADYVVKPGDAEGVGEARASTEGASSVVVAKAPPAAQLPQAGLTSVVALEPEPPAVVDPPTSLNLQELARHAAMGAEKEAIHRWNRRKTAAFLEVSYKTLLNKMKECGISEPRATN